MKEKSKTRLMKFLNSLWAILIFVAFILVIIFSFLEINTIAGQIIWYLSLAITLSELFKKDKPLFKLGTHWGKATVILFITIFGGIFIINVYETTFNWSWYAFTLIGIALILVTICFAITCWKNSEKTKQVKLNIIKTSIKLISFYMLLDLFYMAFIINNLVLKFIFGIVALLIILYSLSATFLGNSKFPKWFLVQDFVIGIGLTVYLIYIIPESLTNLQDIVATIVAAVYGGLLTLVGVAWTIRKGDKDRNDDLKRRDEEKIEEARKQFVPYIKMAYAETVSGSVNASAHSDLKLNDLKGKHFYSFIISSFYIKNISNSNILLLGIFINDNYFEFSNDKLVEKNTVCQVQTTRNFEYASEESLKKLTLVIADVLDNQYEIDCAFTNKTDSPMEVLSDDGKEYIGFRSKYSVSSVSLPKLISKENK